MRFTDKIPTIPHPSRAFWGKVPETNAPKVPTLPQKWEHACSPYAFEWGGGATPLRLKTL